jgi:hypothetical protein
VNHCPISVELCQNMFRACQKRCFTYWYFTQDVVISNGRTLACSGRHVHTSPLRIGGNYCPPGLLTCVYRFAGRSSNLPLKLAGCHRRKVKTASTTHQPQNTLRVSIRNACAHSSTPTYPPLQSPAYPTQDLRKTSPKLRPNCYTYKNSLQYIGCFTPSRGLRR